MGLGHRNRDEKYWPDDDQKWSATSVHNKEQWGNVTQEQQWPTVVLV